MTGPVECFTPTTTPVGADPHRDVNGDGTEDECAAVGRGSRCDTFKQRCTLPYRDRTAEADRLVLHRGLQPRVLRAPPARATHEWDVALRSAVMTARYAECLQHRATPTAPRQYPMYSGQMDDERRRDRRSPARSTTAAQGRAYAGQPTATPSPTASAPTRGYSAGVIAAGQDAGDDRALPQPGRGQRPAGLRLARACPPSVTARRRAPTARTSGDRGASNATCSAAITARMGDLRYHQVNAIDRPADPVALGHHGRRRRPAHRREGRRQHQRLDPRERPLEPGRGRHRPLHQGRAPDRRTSPTAPTCATGPPPPQAASGNGALPQLLRRRPPLELLADLAGGDANGAALAATSASLKGTPVIRRSAKLLLKRS